MPSLTVTDLSRIATEVAHAESSNLEVVGVMVSGEGCYAEVIIDVTDCRPEPCRFSVGVFRDEPPAAVQREIAGQVQRHIRDFREHAERAR